MARETAGEMAPDMTGRVAVVTGATSGIGAATATALARLDAHVALVSRDPAKLETTAAMIVTASPGARVDTFVADFADLGTVRRAAREIADCYDAVDVLVNNAGALRFRRAETRDNLEWQFAVNHAAPFLLTNLLIDPIKAADAGRIVTVSSDAHRMSRLRLEGVQHDLQANRRRYRPFGVYADTKLMNILFTTELVRRLDDTGVTANCLHPGGVATGLGGTPRFLRPVLGLVLASPEDGASTSVYLASASDVADSTGMYFSNSRPRRPSESATDAELAAAVWTATERLVGV